MPNAEPAPIGWNKVTEPTRGPVIVDLSACLSLIVPLRPPLTRPHLLNELVILEGYSVWHEGVYDAFASLATVLSASQFKPSLAGHAGCQAQPAWPHSQLGQGMTEGLPGMTGDR